MIKVGFDFDGVITREPTKFSSFANSIKDKAKIYVITGRPQGEEGIVLSFLKAISFPFDEVFLFPGDRVTEEKIAKWKADVINSKGIDVFIEDHPLFSRFIKRRTKTLLLNPSGESLKSIINFLKKKAQEEFPVEEFLVEEKEKLREQFLEMDKIAEVLGKETRFFYDILEAFNTYYEKLRDICEKYRSKIKEVQPLQRHTVSGTDLTLIDLDIALGVLRSNLDKFNDLKAKILTSIIEDVGGTTENFALLTPAVKFYEKILKFFPQYLKIIAEKIFDMTDLTKREGEIWKDIEVISDRLEELANTIINALKSETAELLITKILPSFSSARAEAGDDEVAMLEQMVKRIAGLLPPARALEKESVALKSKKEKDFATFARELAEKILDFLKEKGVSLKTADEVLVRYFRTSNLKDIEEKIITTLKSKEMELRKKAKIPVKKKKVSLKKSQVEVLPLEIEVPVDIESLVIELEEFYEKELSSGLYSILEEIREGARSALLNFESEIEAMISKLTSELESLSEQFKGEENKAIEILEKIESIIKERSDIVSTLLPYVKAAMVISQVPRKIPPEEKIKKLEEERQKLMEFIETLPKAYLEAAIDEGARFLKEVAPLPSQILEDLQKAYRELESDLEKIIGPRAASKAFEIAAKFLVTRCKKIANALNVGSFDIKHKEIKVHFTNIENSCTRAYKALAALLIEILSEEALILLEQKIIEAHSKIGPISNSILRVTELLERGIANLKKIVMDCSYFLRDASYAPILKVLEEVKGVKPEGKRAITFLTGLSEAFGIPFPGSHYQDLFLEIDRTLKMLKKEEAIEKIVTCLEEEGVPLEEAAKTLEEISKVWGITLPPDIDEILKKMKKATRVIKRYKKEAQAVAGVTDIIASFNEEIDIISEEIFERIFSVLEKVIDSEILPEIEDVALNDVYINIGHICELMEKLNREIEVLCEGIEAIPVEGKKKEAILFKSKYDKSGGFWKVEKDKIQTIDPLRERIRRILLEESKK